MSVLAATGSSGPSSPTTLPVRQDPRTLSNINEILSCISSTQAQEADLSNSLSALLTAREPILASLNRLQSIVPHLDELQAEASQFSEKVNVTAQTAERVGGRVRSLDEEMRRVREASDRAGQVLELKSSLNSLQFSIESQDWESATRHCARAMSLPNDLISGPFSEAAIPTAENHLPPAQTLQVTREQLLKVFRDRFEEGARSRDAATISRFFRLFPAIGWEAEGLEAYASFVVDLVRLRFPQSAKTSSPLYYITACTALFENIAVIVDQHQPVVEKYYGSRKMAKVVKRLLVECDRLVTKLTDDWEEERSMKRKLSDISTTFMGSTSVGAPPLGRRQISSSEDDVDPREIDKTLSELAGMAGRWSLFRKFMVERLEDSNDDVDDTKAANDAVVENAAVPLSSVADGGDDLSKTTLQDAIQILEDAKSHHLFEELLSQYYIPLETWYLRTVIDKAHRLSKTDLLQRPMITTTPDDIFYVLKIIITRILSTGFVKTIMRMLDICKDVLDRDYIGVVRKKLDDVYQNAGNVPSATRDRVERENRIAFIVHLNDLDVSLSHLERLTKDFLSSPSIGQNYLEIEQRSIRSAFSSMPNLASKFKGALKAGIEQLFNQLMRPKLRTVVPDVYKDVSYVLDDDGYSQSEHQNLVQKRFVKTWDSLVDGYKETFTENNYALFFGLALDVFIRPWEKFIMTLKFTELGAIRFDRDLRAIMTYLSSQTVFGDIREKFSRLQQISTILNLDSEEDVDEFYSGSGITWKLSLQEARTVAALKA